MRLAVLSDIHGNLPALEAVFHDAEKHSVDGIIIAGDLVDKGPFPLECVRRVRSLRGWVIRGNGDDYAILPGKDLPEVWRTSPQWGAVRWMRRQLGREGREFIAALPEQLVVALDGADPIRVVHCSPSDRNRSLFPDHDPDLLKLFRKARVLPVKRKRLDLDTVLMSIQERVLVCGNTHIPWKQACKDRMALNPGSVGFSINGDPRAQYALLSWTKGHWQVRPRAVSYDRELVVRAFRERGIGKEGGAMVRAFSLVIQTGHNVPIHFLDHVCALAQVPYLRDVPVSDLVWTKAEQTFDWQAFEATS